MSTVPRHRQHLAYLDGLRACAALTVVVYHALFQAFPIPEEMTGAVKHFGSLFTFGHQAVDLFIVLSGFCLMLPIIHGDGTLKGGALRFFHRRVRRILPPYYFALAFSALCILTLIGNKTGTGWDRCIPITPLGMVTHVLLIQDTVRGVSEQINHSLWSISVEWRLYFLFPLLVILWGRIGALATTTLAILTSYLVFLLLAASPLRAAADPSDAVGMMPHYLGLFTLGMLACNVAFSDTASMSLVRQKTPWGALTLALLILALLCMRMRWHGARIPVAYSDLVVGLWAGTMLIAASFDGLLNRLLSTRGLVFVGTFAYSIYLVHAPLLQILYQYLFHPLGLSKLPLFLAQLSIGTVLIVGASYVFFLCCERPYITGARSAGLQSGRLPS